MNIERKCKHLCFDNHLCFDCLNYLTVAVVVGCSRRWWLGVDGGRWDVAAEGWWWEVVVAAEGWWWEVMVVAEG
ncbi:hypothetical protein Hanom_Chr03g00225041 [Helianthus anomalus]